VLPKVFDLVAIGRAYTDIVSHASDEFLQTYHIPFDGQRESSIDELKTIQQALTQPQIFPGGSSANTVSVIAALGGKAGFFGKVYRDYAGEFFLKDLKQRKVTLCCDCYRPFPSMSATCLVLLNSDQRSFAYNPGCADYFSLEDFEKFDFSKTHFLLIEAHLLTSSIASKSILQVMKQAKDKSEIVINLQGIKQWDSFNEIVRHIISYASIIIGNKDEQTAFNETVHSLQPSQQISQISITTKGADGAEIYQPGQLPYSVPAIVPKMFVSSAGAGDAFIAGFLLSRSKGMGIKKSMHHAVLTATAILEETGARPTHSLSYLFPTTAKILKENNMGLFSQKIESSADIRAEIMAKTSFSQGSNTAKRLRAHAPSKLTNN